MFNENLDNDNHYDNKFNFPEEVNNSSSNKQQLTKIFNKAIQSPNPKATFLTSVLNSNTKPSEFLMALLDFNTNWR